MQTVAAHPDLANPCTNRGADLRKSLNGAAPAISSATAEFGGSRGERRRRSRIGARIPRTNSKSWSVLVRLVDDLGLAFLSMLLLRSSVERIRAQSTPVLSSRSINGQAEVTVQGLPGTTNQLQYANGLLGSNPWQPLTNMVLATNPASFLDTSAALASNRFYRTEMIGGGETAGALETALATGLAQALADLGPDPLDFELTVSRVKPEQRVPVVVWSGNQWEERHFLDLNRNGRFEDSAGFGQPLPIRFVAKGQNFGISPVINKGKHMGRIPTWQPTG